MLSAAVVLVVSGAFLGTLYAQVQGLRVTASIDLHPAVVDGKPALAGNYQLTCNIQDAKTTYGFGEMKLYYAITVGDGDHDVEVTGSSGLFADAGLGNSKRESALEVTGPLGGSRVKAKFSGAYCHHEQLNSDLITVWSPLIVIPPQVSVVSAFDPQNPNATPYVSMLSPPKLTDVIDVPAGKQLAIMLDINAHPHGTESVVLRYEGAGVNFTQVLYDVAKDYAPMKELVTPTQVGGTMKVWAEIRPSQTQSNVLQFRVVADGAKPADDSKPGTTSPKPKKKSAVKKAKH